MICPNCDQPPISPIKFFFTFNQSKIKCRSCGVMLKGDRLLRSMFYGALIFGLILGLSVAILGDIYNWGFIKSLMIAFVVISIFGIPAEFIGWKYGRYEVQELDTAQTATAKRILVILFLVIGLLIFLGLGVTAPVARDLGDCYEQSLIQLEQHSTELQSEEWDKEKFCQYGKESILSFYSCHEEVKSKRGFLVPIVEKIIIIIRPKILLSEDMKAIHNATCSEFPATLVQ